MKQTALMIPEKVQFGTTVKCECFWKNFIDNYVPTENVNYIIAIAGFNLSLISFMVLLMITLRHAVFDFTPVLIVGYGVTAAAVAIQFKNGWYSEEVKKNLFFWMLLKSFESVSFVLVLIRDLTDIGRFGDELLPILLATVTHLGMLIYVYKKKYSKQTNIDKSNDQVEIDDITIS